MTTGLLLAMMSPAEGGDAEYNDWANTEHLPQRQRIEGIRTAIRFVNKAESPRYLQIYDVDNVSVLHSPEYLAVSGEHSSPWSRRISAGASARWRFIGSRADGVVDSFMTGSRGQLSELLVVRWSKVPARHDEDIASALQRSIARLPGVVHARTFVSEGLGPFDYVGLVESTLPYEAGVTDTGRYSLDCGPSDFAQVFLPLLSQGSLPG
jgi:hypothetical protein